MDHHEQHHQHHEKEREEKKKEHKKYEQEHEKNRLPLHPGWLFAAGILLVIVALAIWTFFVW